jgi:hypothetical protein
METFKIYKNMSVTPDELFEALTKLGYDNQSNSEKRRFVKKSHKSVIELANEPIDARLMNMYFAGFSYRLFLQGVINDPHDLAKMIEKNREKAKAEMVAA